MPQIVTALEGRLEGREEWIRQGIEKGLTQGRTEGRTQGRTEGLQAGLLIAEIQFLQRQFKHSVSSPAELAQLSIDNLSLIASTLRSSAQQN